MRFVTKPLALALALGLLSLSLAATSPSQAAPPARQISLMQTLKDWAYPGTMDPGAKLEDASMSDGGNPTAQSVNCKAILTTPDPVAKVVAYYEQKLRTDGPADPTAARSVSTQDDSAGRTVAVHVIVVNRAETSTTLVISRAEGERATHIAWSHHIRLGGR